MLAVIKISQFMPFTEVYFFMFYLFNETVSSSNYTVSTDTMINE